MKNKEKILCKYCFSTTNCCTDVEFETCKNIIKQSNQETIKELAERVLANNIDGLKDVLQDDDLFFFYKNVILCYGETIAELQANKIYNKEDMMSFGNFCADYEYRVFGEKTQEEMLKIWNEE